jgi:hypothetical protein
MTGNCSALRELSIAGGCRGTDDRHAGAIYRASMNA